MSDPLSIACLSHVASAAAPTGAERSLALLAGGLQRRGHRVVVVVPGPWTLSSLLRATGVEVQIVRSRSCWLTYYEPRPWHVAWAKWARWAWPGSRARLTRFLRTWGPDVVHVNCLPHLHGAAAARAAGCPVVWHLREILPAGTRRRWLAAHVARHATSVVAVSQAVGTWVRDEGLGQKLSVVPNGVEISSVRIDQPSARRALGLPEDGLLVALVGQLVPHKGAALFVEAGRRALAEEPELRFLLVGGGPPGFREQVRAQVAATGAPDRFHLVPPQPAGDTAIAACDILCLATLTPDPLPRAVLEAMAASRPVVGLRLGGTTEMVQDGRTGLLVEPGDVDGLARAFVRLARDATLRSAMGRAGAQRAADEFSLELHLDRMEQLLRGVAR